MDKDEQHIAEVDMALWLLATRKEGRPWEETEAMIRGRLPGRIRHHH
jgi:hypothetical protein